MDGSGPSNIILVVADQLRRSALGCYGDVNVQTPAIDSLAASGVRFANACSTYPVCVPFRFTLMTGEYAHTRLVPAIGWRMSPAERTIADVFNDNGYHTAYFGKWHLYGGYGRLAGPGVFGSSRTPIPRPFRGGWQHFAGFDLCNDPFDTDYFVDDDPQPRKVSGYQTDGVFDLAIDYLRQPERHGGPFAAVVSVEPPHPPLTAPPRYLDRLRARRMITPGNAVTDKDYGRRGPHGQGLEDDMRTYYAMIENLDDNVARLLAALREQHLHERTVVILTSDHGELLGSHGLVDKQYPYEESVGIPLIVGGAPGHRRPGTVIQDPACTEDLFPTILGLAGLTPPAGKPGADLSPLIRGDTGKLARHAVLLEFVAEQRRDMPFWDRTWRGIRTRDHKYTVLGDMTGGRPWQFFDLASDPYETRNLVDDPAYAGQVSRHHRMLRQMLVSTHDHYVLAPARGQPGLNGAAADQQQRAGAEASGQLIEDPRGPGDAITNFSKSAQ